MTHYKPKKKQNEDIKKTLRITESDLVRLVKKIINEQTQGTEISFDKFKKLVERENFRGELSTLPLSRITGINTVKIYSMVGDTQGATTNSIMNLVKKEPNIPFKSYTYTRTLDNGDVEVLVAVKVS